MTITTLKTQPAPRFWPALLLIAFLASFITASLAPPFSAPDEFDHIKRAYMFGQGQLLLHSENGSPSGGNIDAGLAEYMDSFTALPGHNSQKISGAELIHAGEVAWKGKNVFVTPVGTSYYFPALYAPQAIGLMAGKTLGLSVNKSYRLARLLTLLTCLSLLILACRIFPPPPAVIAVLVLPMNVFLFAAPSLDGLTTSTAALALAAFMRIAIHRREARDWVVWVCLVSLCLVCTSRANAAPFLLLPFAVWWFTRDRRHLFASIMLAVFVVGWTVFTIKTTVYPPGPRHIDQMAKLASYIKHPEAFFKILYATLADSGVRGYYFSSFIGSLGWLDTSLPIWSYRIFGLLLLIAAVFSFARDAIIEQPLACSLLIVCAIGTVLMTYLAMLVQWTIGDSAIIQGVQGRYFMIPALAIMFALGGDFTPRSSIAYRISIGAAGAIALLAAYFVPQAVAMRYFMAQEPNTTAFQSSLTPTQALGRNAVVPVALDPSQAARPMELSGIDIMFGTYNRSNPGNAELRAWTRSGEITTVQFELSSLVDNAYHHFPLDGKRYVGAEIVSRGGEGVSVWTVRIGDKVQMACIALQDDAGNITATPGCPSL
ncbi:putative membrane protein [Rhodanobacter sp. TND4EL1]